MSWLRRGSSPRGGELSGDLVAKCGLGSQERGAGGAERPGTVLGVSALYHDAAACVVDGGQVLAAAQEERFTRIKHDASFPVHAIRWCLSEAGVMPGQLTKVVFYEKPLLKFDRIMETHLRYAPTGLSSFVASVGSLLDGKLKVPKLFDTALGQRFEGDVLFVEHHQAHAASAYFPSPFERAAILTVDGVGEWSTTTIGRGDGGRVDLHRALRFPHSLGLLYSAFTAYAGFKVNSGEYKLMGLAPYGSPRYAQVIFDELVELRDDGSFRLNMRYFDFCHRLRTVNDRFCALFGGPARAPEGPIEKRFLDVAASIQVVTEEVMLRLVREAHRMTGEENLCLAGGVALNCVANGRIVREGPFDRVWIQPAAGDAGGALGAALLVSHQLDGAQRRPVTPDGQRGSLLGPAWSTDEVKAILEGEGAQMHTHETPADVLRAAVDLLAQGKVVGWFQGRMEFGPRALGARSILADPRVPGMQSTVNRRIKFREGFRPFAPVVNVERMGEYFELDRESPYMLLVAPVSASQRLALDVPDEAALSLSERLALRRSRIGAVTHVDFSARVQTCDSARNPRLHALLELWEQATGCGVLLNTSFNVRGEPIVCSPLHAWACFMRTDMDALVIEDIMLLKQDQVGVTGDSHARSFAAD